MPKADETSIWKKDITFRRKPKAAPAAAAAAEPEETSIWKKEITFRRKTETAAEPSRAVGAVPPRRVAAPVEQPMQRLPVVEQSSAAPLPPVTVAAAAPAVPPTPLATPGPQPAPGVHDRSSGPSLASGASTDVPAPQRPHDRPLDDDASVPPVSAPVAAPAQSQPSTVAAAARNKKAEGSSHKTHKRVVGLKIGASQIAAAYVENKNGPTVVRVARTPLPHGIVVGGEVREPAELAAALKAFFRKHKLPTSCVRLGISNNRIGVRTFEIAGIEDEAQLANAIRFRAQETLPIPLTEAVMDYRILDESVGADGVRVRRVLIVVAHRELVERYLAACRKAGLKLLGIDLEAFALLRAVSDPAAPPAGDAALVCVAVGHDRSTLAVSDGSVCEFTRVLAWGGSALNVALARSLDLAPASVEPLKHELVPGEVGDAAGLDAERAAKAREAMALELRSFAPGARWIAALLPGAAGLARDR